VSTFFNDIITKGIKSGNPSTPNMEEVKISVATLHTEIYVGAFFFVRDLLIVGYLKF
jgi:hypothetical protein